MPADSAEVVAAVDAFHRALAESDSAEVRRLLTADVLILEGGIVEDREEYLGHHLGADMAFAAAVPGNRELLRVEVHDSAAWVATRGRRQGTFRGREIDSQGAELVVLRRTASGWRIASVHWSSR
jgi:ketosteroid isomerase-like protein